MWPIWPGLHECIGMRRPSKLRERRSYYPYPPQSLPLHLKDLPLEAQPREKLLGRGLGALSDAELLAILLRTGIAGKSVLQMAEELLQLQNNSASRTKDFSRPAR